MTATLAYLAGATGKAGGRFAKGGGRVPGGGRHGFSLDEVPSTNDLQTHFAGTAIANSPQKWPVAWAYQRLGFDKSKPETVDYAGDVHERRDVEMVLHRGISDSVSGAESIGSSARSADEMHDEFLNGDHFVGLGRYGNGTYTTPSAGEARAYGRMGASGGGVTQTMGLKKGTRIVDFVPATKNAKSDYVGAVSSMEAMAQGAQAMRVRKTDGTNDYFVIFDRGALVVAQEPESVGVRDSFTAGATVHDMRDSLTAAPTGWSPLTDPLQPLIILDARHPGSFDALVAPWGSCILNGGEGRGKCVQPPVDGDSYRYAHVAGSQAIIPMGLPHADVRLPVSAAVQHYADTGYAAAVVTYHEDELGIWASGDLVPGLSERDKFVISKAALSGDWRWIEEEGRYRMIASQIVNTPGFRSAYAGKRQFAMAASAGALITSWEPIDWRGALLELLERNEQVEEEAPSAVRAYLAGATGQPGGRFGTGGKRIPGRGQTGVAPGPRRTRKTLAEKQLALFKDGSAMAHLESDGHGGQRFTAERHALHEQIIADELAKGRVNDSGTPQLTMLGGGPASGKTTVLPVTGVKVDPDAIKARLPGYKPKGKAVSFVHEESSYVAKEMVSRGLAARFDVTIDGVGGSVESVAAKVAEARSHGFAAHGVYVTASVEDALARNRGRERTVPVAVLRHGHAQVAGNFERLLPLFDSMTLTENATGSALRSVAHSGANGSLVIDNEAAWRSFRAKRPRKPGAGRKKKSTQVSFVGAKPGTVSTTPAGSGVPSAGAGSTSGPDPNQFLPGWLVASADSPESVIQ